MLLREEDKPGELIGSRIRKSVVEIGCDSSVSNEICHPRLETPESFVQVSDQVQGQPVVPEPKTPLNQ